MRKDQGVAGGTAATPAAFSRCGRTGRTLRAHRAVPVTGQRSEAEDTAAWAVCSTSEMPSFIEVLPSERTATR